jgi:2-oxoglutarate ferredoxin oxidoreductase subunit gamma
VERAVLLTGIGGQGVQLAAQILARAAVVEGREVMMLGTYGGTMRGGSTDSSLVVSDAPIHSPPIVARAWAGIAMHDRFWAPTAAKLGEGSLVVVNAGLFQTSLDRDTLRVFEVRATEIAADVDAALAASLVLAGAFAVATGFVGLDSSIEAMLESVPSYRKQHLEANERALRAGFEALPPGVVPAWHAVESAA